MSGKGNRCPETEAGNSKWRRASAPFSRLAPVLFSWLISCGHCTLLGQMAYSRPVLCFGIIVLLCQTLAASDNIPDDKKLADDTLVEDELEVIHLAAQQKHPYVLIKF